MVILTNPVNARADEMIVKDKKLIIIKIAIHAMIVTRLFRWYQLYLFDPFFEVHPSEIAKKVCSCHHFCLSKPG